MEIDWSKAPEGYDFALSSAAGWNGAPEFRGTVRFAMRDGRGRFKDETGMHPQIGLSAWEVIAERPEPWTGDGLPPVGTVCEIAASTEYQKVSYPEGTKVKVYANFTDDRGVELAAFVDELGKVGGVGVAKCLRPCRTPEQIAAEELKAAIDAMSDVTQGARNWLEAFQKLHESGYRKVTP